MTVTSLDDFRPPADEDGFRSPDVCRIADVTYRQLDYWARTDLAVPSVRDAHGSGTQRLYSESDVLRVCVVATLLRAGFSLSILRQSVPAVLATAQDGVGFFTAPDVVTVDIAGLQARVDEHRERIPS